MASAQRRQCTLEVLAATPAVGGEPWVVESSVRDVATLVGVARNTTHSTISTLRDAGLITVIQGHAFGGRFGPSVYRLTLEANVLRRDA